MQDVIDRAAQKNVPGIRLHQTGFHNRSLCLYTKLGFRTRETVSILQGTPLRATFAGYKVRPATVVDGPACNRVCQQVHGHDREVELRDAKPSGRHSFDRQCGRTHQYQSPSGSE